MDSEDSSIIVHIHIGINPKEARVVADASGVRNAEGKWRGGQYCNDCHTVGSGDICAAAPDTALEHCTQETGSLFDTLIHGNILRYDG